MQQRALFILLLLLTLQTGEHAFAQAGLRPLRGAALFDSLLKELASDKYRKYEDTNKVKLLCKLSDSYQDIKPDEAFKYGQQGLVLAEKLNWKKGIAFGNRALGMSSYGKSDYPGALQYLGRAEQAFEKLSDKNGLADVIMNIGNVHKEQSDYPAALGFYFKALKIAENTGDVVSQAKINGNIGNVYFEESYYPQALDYYFKDLKMADELDDKDGVAAITGNIGNIYQSQGEYGKALEYDLKSLKMYQAIGDQPNEVLVTGNIGEVYYYYGDYTNALSYDFKALQMNEQVGDKGIAAFVTGNIGNVYVKEKNYEMAVAYCLESLKMNEEIGDKHFTALALFQIGNAYLSLVSNNGVSSAGGGAAVQPDGNKLVAVPIPGGKAARLQNAARYMQAGLDTARKIHALDVMKNCYQGLASISKLMGNYKQAMENYQDYTAIKDSVFSKENEKKLMHTTMQYDYEKKHIADSMKSAEKEKINRIELHRQQSYTWIGIAGALALLGFSFFMLRNNKLLAREKKRSEDLLLNILPAEVATELKDTGGAAAKHYDNVTVLFTDFVNFTQASENMGPQALIDELHTCFKTFDEITARHRIEKIKTIGDAYLAVCGLPVADPRHAQHVIMAALEINKFINDRQEQLGDQAFQVRIGVHSGSVVAGIVGVKKFAYDIWGDTVNTAARMEQHSEAGKINISQATYELVKDGFECVYRGEIDAKNKGQLKMYYVQPLTAKGGPAI